MRDEFMAAFRILLEAAVIGAAVSALLGATTIYLLLTVGRLPI